MSRKHIFISATRMQLDNGRGGGGRGYLSHLYEEAKAVKT